MTPPRGHRAAPPAPEGQWEVRFSDAAAAKGWEDLCQQHRTCEQWQIEVTGGGRVWYLVDVPHGTCWVTYAGTAHPRATDRR
ncbi:hypothetical protein AT728_05060 [Streptomyces silvensis]|uniref:Uncharacterized protein n=1 Tax=Streptomyces silvensis TaxID=1765722 RepID=A0A0W7XA48_9ACTN|nr:hypothetical protein [Streptomyces silvensis]KUF19725.1 hypothetical protein AT728_05060 [Streptomyces silvensis]